MVQPRNRARLQPGGQLSGGTNPPPQTSPLAGTDSAQDQGWYKKNQEWIKNSALVAAVGLILLIILQIPELRIGGTNVWMSFLVKLTIALIFIRWYQGGGVEGTVAIMTVAFFFAVIIVFLGKSPAEIGKSVSHFWGSSTTSAPPPIVTPQVSKGWRINSNGEFEAHLSPGTSADPKVFVLPEGYYSPWIVIPSGNYRYSISHLETVVLETGGRRHVINPNDSHHMGIRSSQKFRFQAPKGGAHITMQVWRE